MVGFQPTPALRGPSTHTGWSRRLPFSTPPDGLKRPVIRGSGCTARSTRPIAFPETVEAALRVGHLGRSSARYEIGLFAAGRDDPAATGWFVHVFVDREARRAVEIPAPLRGALERLVVAG